jgi:hypothetical protein
MNYTNWFLCIDWYNFNSIQNSFTLQSIDFSCTIARQMQSRDGCFGIPSNRETMLASTVSKKRNI